MLTMCIVVLALATPGVSAQAPVGFSGKWVAEDARMGAGGEAVESAMDAHLLPRMARTPGQRALLIEEGADALHVERPGGIVSRISLPSSGATVTVKEAAGSLITARALRDGAVLVVHREHRIRLGGSDVLIEVEERYELLADGTLRVETTSKSGDLVHTQRTDYRRVQ